MFSHRILLSADKSQAKVVFPMEGWAPQSGLLRPRRDNDGHLKIAQGLGGNRQRRDWTGVGQARSESIPPHSLGSHHTCTSPPHPVERIPPSAASCSMWPIPKRQADPVLKGSIGPAANRALTTQPLSPFPPHSLKRPSSDPSPAPPVGKGPRAVTCRGKGRVA